MLGLQVYMTYIVLAGEVDAPRPRLAVLFRVDPQRFCDPISLHVVASFQLSRLDGEVSPEDGLSLIRRTASADMNPSFTLPP